MSRVKLSDASTQEIEAFAKDLKQVGYLIVQVSPWEFEVRPPVPAHIATTRQRILAEREPVRSIADEPEQSFGDQEENEFDCSDTSQREFILAPLFRRLLQPVRWEQFAFKGKISQAWHESPLLNLWRKNKHAAVLRYMNFARKILAIAIAAREPKQVRIVVASQRNAFDRIGWTMIAVLSPALILLIGLQMSHTQSAMQPAPMPPIASTDVQSSATSVVSKPSAQGVAKHKQQSARGFNRNGASDAQEVVVRHFSLQKTQPQLQQVAGVKHFSDMNQ